MATKGTTATGGLSAAFHKQMDKFLDAVWAGIASGDLTEAEGKAYIAHIISMMRVQDADAVAHYFDVVLGKPAATRWKI